jgi:hypothetical protein
MEIVGFDGLEDGQRAARLRTQRLGHGHGERGGWGREWQWRAQRQRDGIGRRDLPPYGKLWPPRDQRGRKVHLGGGTAGRRPPQFHLDAVSRR